MRRGQVLEVIEVGEVTLASVTAVEEPTTATPSDDKCSAEQREEIAVIRG